MHKQKPLNLLGIAIESTRILWVQGRMVNDEFPQTIGELEFKHDTPQEVPIKPWMNFERDFGAFFEFIFEQNPEIENIGVSCYGAFTNYEVIGDTIAFTQLGETKGLRSMLSNRLLKSDLEKLANQHSKKQINVWIESDVAIEAVGYTHMFSNDPNKEWFLENKKKRKTAIIKSDYGVGGAFIDFSGKAAWRGVSHTEIGQINLKEWHGERQLRDEMNLSLFDECINEYSVEAYASIPSIEYYYRKPFEELKKNPDAAIWHRQAWYLAQLAWASTCYIAPNNIVFTGETIAVPGLLEKIRVQFDSIKNTPENSIPYSLEMHSENYIDDYLVDLIKKSAWKHPAIRGVLCFAALTNEEGGPKNLNDNVIDITTRSNTSSTS